MIEWKIQKMLCHPGQILIFPVLNAGGLHCSCAAYCAWKSNWGQGPVMQLAIIKVNNGLTFFNVKVDKSCYSLQDVFWGNFFCTAKESGWTWWPTVIPSNFNQPVSLWQVMLRQCSGWLLHSRAATCPGVHAFLLTPIRLVEGGENQLHCGWDFKKLKVSGKQFLLRLCENPKSGSQNAFQEKGFFRRFACSPSGYNWNDVRCDFLPRLFFQRDRRKKMELLQSLEEKTEPRCELERSLPGAALPKAIFSSWCWRKCLL